MAQKVSEKALAMLRTLPRISLNNLRDTNWRKTTKRGRAQHGGDKHGDGNKGSGQRQNFMPLGYETGNNPFYLRFPNEPYYRGHHLRRQYPPLSLLQLQKMIDTNRIDTSKPIDLAAISNTGLYYFAPEEKHYGVNLTDEGADIFSAKVNLEVQWASEGTIAAVERNGGVITTAFYDINSLFVLKNAERFFKKGEAVPKRMLPPQDAIVYYTSAANRGYLADPEQIAYQRLALSQKFGYVLPEINENDEMYQTLMETKDPRQILYGIEPGWIVNLTDKIIYKPKDHKLLEYFRT